jgi:hypothetical protein
MGSLRAPTGPGRMATTTANRPSPLSRDLPKPLSSVGTACLLVLVGLAITVQFPTVTPLAAIVAVGTLSIVAWMFVSERYEWSLAILMLYIGLADGYLKLKTGSSQATLVRDLLLYAIAVGALIRIAVRHESLTLPPLTGWVIAWLLVVAVQIANPSNGTFTHSLASVRPHAEWVPLFFLGYVVMRSKARIQRFLLLLLVVAAVNGIVGLIQLNLTPEQLSAWGPGYERAISGEGDVSARTFTDEGGTERTRPFGLGGDFGFGGIVGLVAVPAALGLLALSRRPDVRFATALLSIGMVLAIATSQSRTAVLGSVIAVLAFAALTVTSRAGLKTVIALGLTITVTYATVSLLSSNSEQGSFDRYNSINSPGQAVGTAYDYRRDTLAKIPTYITEIPFGAGIGSKGPASSFAGRADVTGRRLDSESEPTFLLIELGLPGLAVMLGFNLVLFYLSITRIRRIADRETRILLTAVAAPLFAIFSAWFVGVCTATVPGAPYLWFAAGVLSFWLLGEGHRSLALEESHGASGAGAPTWQARWSNG